LIGTSRDERIQDVFDELPDDWRPEARRVLTEFIMGLPDIEAALDGPGGTDAAIEVIADYLDLDITDDF
jgi:hypothetical protein